MKISIGKKIYRPLGLAAASLAVLTACLALAASASAAAPSLSLTVNGDGDTVELSVKGDANKSVIFYYLKSGAGAQLSFLGTTDSAGNFTTNISTVAYSIAQGGLVHVVVNGQSSVEASWPNIAASSVLTLSPTSLVLSLGQSATVTAYNNGTNLIYLSNNSNPPVANVNVNGNQLAVTALNYGSTIISICAQASSPSCASVYLTVQNTGGKAITFSQSSATVASGQTTKITVHGGNDSYVLLSNSNPGVIQAALSGSAISLTTTLTSGSSAITVCSSNMSSCGIINAVVGGAPSSGLSFSQTDPTMTVSQTLSLTISGGSGTYSLSSNSDSDVVSAVVSGNNLILTAKEGGEATIMVCSSTGNCASEEITVNSSASSTGGPLKLSQTNLWLNVNQSATITISGGHQPYSASGYSSSIVTAAVDNYSLTITGVNPGSTSIDVCSGGGCTGLSVLVQGVSSTASLSLSKNQLSLTPGAVSTVSLSGNGNYFVAYNTNSNVAAAAISGSTVTVNGLAAGLADVSVCQNGGQCAVLSISVAAASTATPATDTTSAADDTSSWTACAGEKQQCAFSGSRTVRYGASGKYYYGIFTSGAACSNATFGDPIENTVKTCSYGGAIPAGATVISAAAQTAAVDWTACADEKQQCAFSGQKSVRYGASGKYRYGTYSGGVLCANSVFGDPIENTVKTCSYGGAVPANADPAAPAKFKFSRALSYGSTGDEVKQLQQRLKDEGLYTGAIDGRYLTSTVASMKKYQKNQGITQTGNLGPLTMSALNK